MIKGVVCGVIAAIAIIGGSIMRLFGFEYKSVGSIIRFFVVVMVLGFPLDIVSSALPRAFVVSGRSTEKQGIEFFVILDTLFSAVSMALADYFMDSVPASDLAILIISFLFAVTSAKDFREEVRKDQGEENED